MRINWCPPAARELLHLNHPPMTFEEFQYNARLYTLGALDPEEASAFAEARAEFGAEAEAFLEECYKLHAAFALSLRPQPPKQDARQRLMDLIKRASAAPSPDHGEIAG